MSETIFSAEETGAQVSCHGLLPQQQAHAQVLYGALLCVGALLDIQHLQPQRVLPAVQHGLCRGGYGLLAHGAHQRQLPVEPFQLFVKARTHHPNLPVI
jgi:hypothetical protein